MTDAPTSGLDDRWDEQVVRRTLRLLGSHAPNILDPAGRERSLRLLCDVFNRQGVSAEIHERDDTLPMLIAGNGSTLVVTHLDDAAPSAQVPELMPPSMLGGAAYGPGLIRKAGVLAVAGLLTANDAPDITLVIELDRYDGSRALAAWLAESQTERQFTRAFVEVVDLPVPAPAVFRAATGRVVVDVSIAADRPHVAGLFAGVVGDIAHELVHALNALKSPDGEVFVSGFYDAVITPGPAETAVLNEVAPYVSSWVMRDRRDTGSFLNASHTTLGLFLAPALAVTELQITGGGPWLPECGTARVDARVMPGQDANAIARSIVELLTSRSPRISATPSLVSPAAVGDAGALSVFPDLNALSLPVAPGDSPAGLVERAGVPTSGFSTVWRDPAAFDEQIGMDAILSGTQFLRELVRTQ